MSTFVLVLLGGLWACLLLPGALRARRQPSPLDTISAFERTMRHIAPARTGTRPPGRHVLVLADPPSVTGRRNRVRTLARRRAALVALASATVVAVALALSFGGLFAWVAGAAAAALMTYAAELRHEKSRAAHRAKLRRLPTAGTSRHVETVAARRRGA